MSGDLPSSEIRVNTGSVALLSEATGTGPLGPFIEQYTTTIHLYSADTPSVGLTADWVIKNSDGTLPRSVERWMRLRFTPPFGAITDIRFWTDNYDPAEGWAIQWGLADTYKNPSYVKSRIAISPLPVADPGIGNPNLPINTLETLSVGYGATLFTNWIVFQAAWKNDLYTLSQPAPINLNFAWREA